jgi:FtsP/CotA-like multicopper oxidase with cupredoxin domain/plastocyanin
VDPKPDRGVGGTIALIFAALAMMFGFFAFIMAAQAESETGGVPAGGVQVTLSEFAVNPATIQAPVDGKLVVTNSGSIAHNFYVDETDVHTSDLQAGESATLDLDGLEAGTYTVYCAVAGHKEAGMQASLVVGGGSGSGTHDMASMDFDTASPEELAAMNDEMDASMKHAVDMYIAQLEEGPNTKGVGNQPLKAKVLADGTKEFHLTAKLADWEVEPGETVRAWTFNGMVPGPWIKLDVGDKVRIVVKNDLPNSTGVHYHGMEVPFEMDGVPDVTQEPIKPGDSFVYEFVAKKPQMGMYHSHHNAQVQVPNGMLGIFQVGDPALPAGTGPVTQEVPMVLNDAGVIGLTLNGKSFPATAPVIANVGDWVRIDYYNEGLQVHPMHLHGLPQLVINEDGYPLPQPYTVDTLMIAPGQRFSTLVQVTSDFLGKNDTPGIWAFHCHILTHAEGPTGMFGMVTTLIVQP